MTVEENNRFYEIYKNELFQLGLILQLEYNYDVLDRVLFKYLIRYYVKTVSEREL